MKSSGGRGRPRDAEVDCAILQATREILDEAGYPGLTMADVAERAHVTKPTVYLRWPSKVSLVADAVSEMLSLGPLPDTGTFRGDLLALLRLLAHGLLKKSAGRILEDLIADIHRDPDLTLKFRESFFVPRWRYLETILERAIARGEIAADVNVEMLTDIFVGPIYYRLLVRADPPRFELQQETVDLVLAGLEALRSRSKKQNMTAAIKKSSTRNMQEDKAAGRVRKVRIVRTGRRPASKRKS